jgi:serine protease Do
LRGGWQLERARALVEKRQGILLTSIAPGSPAALAQLKPGDVILSVNNGDVRNADDFSWLLDEAGLGSSVNFTVARPEKLLAEALAIKLSESPDPFFGLRRLEAFAPRVLKPGSLMAQGIEAIAIKPRVASRFGASGGLLVVWVQPATPASRAGLKPGDLIEAINGQQISSTSAPIALSTTPGAKSTFVIVRNKQKLVLTIQTTEKQ